MAILPRRSGRFSWMLRSLGTAIVLGSLGILPAHSQSTASKSQAPAATPADNGEVTRLINEQLADSWKANKLKPSDRCTDYEFIRRASLDIIGRIATPAEIQRFMKDPPETRRKLLVDRLLAMPEYAEHFADIWTVLLMTRVGALDANRRVYHQQMNTWLKEQFGSPGASWKEMVHDLVTASGKTNDKHAVNFILAHLGEAIPPNERKEKGYFEMVPITSRTTKLFLGLQTQCTQCHDHPFNPEWKQHHFWGVNAFFRQVKREGNMAMRAQDQASVLELKEDPSVNQEGLVYYEKRNGSLLSTKAVFLDDSRPNGEGSSRRDYLARFLTNHEKFPEAFVNRTWGHFFGRGFTSPVDDFGEHNPISHPELLKELGKRFSHYGYNPQLLVRWICNSDAYQLSSVANKTNEKADVEPFFSRMLLKALAPEQLFDSLLVATRLGKAESKEKKEAWMRSLTTNFGDDEGNETTFNGTVVQALLMMNGNAINEAITHKDGTVSQAFLRWKGQPNTLNELFMATLNRPPTAQESSRIMNIIRTAPTRNKVNPLLPWQDVFWALVNSNEFMLNH